MAYEDVNSIRLLKNLFDQCRVDGEIDSSDSGDDGDFVGLSTLGPASVKPKKSEIKRSLENPLLKQLEAEPAIASMEEWEQQQVKDDEMLDTRKQPSYKIAYKQVVTTEDIYLQMGLKTPATSSCEDMIIDIDLPDETVNIDQMDLKVEAEVVNLQTPVYRLSLPLPHKVHPKKGRAEFDSDKKVLKLTMRLNRELDFVNFWRCEAMRGRSLKECKGSFIEGISKLIEEVKSGRS